MAAEQSGVAGWLQLRPAWEKRVAWAGLALVVLAAVALPVIDKYWPYRYRNVLPLLETVFASKITVGRYHRTYFPHPGFVADGLTLRRNNAQNLPPIGSTRQLIVQGTWLDLLLLRQRVRLVDVTGLRVVIPPVGSAANHQDFPPGSSADFAGPSTTVEQLHIHESELDILRTNGGRYAFPIRDLSIRNLRSGQTISYVVDMQNAMPSGRIRAHGSFGPLTPANLGGTPLSGDFSFARVNLGDLGSLHGTLSATGHFSGTLAAIEAQASSETPDFAVGSGTPTDAAGTVQATIDGLNANIVLHQIEAKIGTTKVEVGGQIVGSPKVTDVEIAVTRGRAEDLLRPFVRSAPPVTGVVWLKTHAHVAAGGNGAKFLDRLQMDGGFNVPAERLTNHSTETELSSFSQRAQGSAGKSPAAQGAALVGDPQQPDVLSSLEGTVSVRRGVMSTERLTFKVPGVAAELKGTYRLQDGTVHMVGNLTMDTDLSHVTTGFKSMLLKPLAPFFKRKSAGAVIPIAITGKPNQYKVGQDLLHDK
jgi:hypothetical protein